MPCEFLPQLRNIHASKNTQERGCGEDFLFLITKTGSGVALKTVSKALQPMEPDYHFFSGEKARLLRSLDKIREEKSFEISWDDDSEDILLNDYPHLIYLLVRCDNIADEKANKVSVNNDTSTMELMLSEKDGWIKPILSVVGCDDFVMLSDSFVMTLSDNPEICPVMPVGDNYRQLDYFRQPFPDTMLEQYLSVFFSFVANVTVKYDDYDIETAETECQTFVGHRLPRRGSGGDTRR